MELVGDLQNVLIGILSNSQQPIIATQRLMAESYGAATLIDSGNNFSGVFRTKTVPCLLPRYISPPVQPHNKSCSADAAQVPASILWVQQFIFTV